MVFINAIAKEIHCKVVYYGAGLSGKTTNIEYIYKRLDPSRRGKLVSLKTDSERTLFFDFLPIDIGKIRGMNLRIHLYSVPGQVFLDPSRRLILKGVDGLVFVVDSQPDRMDANIESLSNLKRNLLMNSLVLDHLPMVLQYNKADIPGVVTQQELASVFNPEGKYVEFAASAKTGIHVFDTFKTIVKEVAKQVQH